MDDLLFKNIPAEGFDPNCGFSERISNPTPSRTAAVDDRLSSTQTRESVSTGYSDDSDRLSNATPTRRTVAPTIPSPPNSPCSFDGSDRMSSATDRSRMSNTSSERTTSTFTTSQPTSFGNATEYSDIADRMSSATPTRRRSADSVPVPPPTVLNDGQRGLSEVDDSRASNPTPTRRGRTDNPFEVPNSYIPPVDSDSRVSNPTPTRRRQSGSSEPPVTFSSLGVEVPDDVGRASNPTPTRRSSVSAVPPISEQSGISISATEDDIQSRMSSPTPTRRTQHGFVSPFVDDSSVQTKPLSFASATDPYGVDDSRASNPTPTRRDSQSQSIFQDEGFGFNDDDRMSSCTPSSRK